MQKKSYSYALLVLAVGIGVFADYLFYGKAPGVSFFVFAAVFGLGIIIVARSAGKKLTSSQWFLLAAGFSLSGFVAIRASGFLTFFNIVGTLYIGILLFSLFFHNPLEKFSFLRYFLIPFFSLSRTFSGASRFLEGMSSSIKTEGVLRSSNARGVLRGTVIALPFLFIFALLFYSADLVVRSFVERFVHVNIDPAIFWHAVIVLIISYLALGVFSKIVASKTEQLEEEKHGKKLFGFVESITVLSLVGALFGGFVLVQFFYLFGGESYIWEIPGYVTYAQYARHGFGELLGVALISFVLLYGVEKFGVRGDAKKENIFAVVSFLLVGEVGIIMASAWQRLSLYTDAFGFTFDRLLAFWFLLWVFTVFILFLWKLVRKKKERLFFVALFWCSLLFWVGLNVVNPDAFIAEKNIERYIEGKQFDSLYIGSLSADAVPEMVRIFDLTEEEGVEEMQQKLAERLYRRYAGWPSDYHFIGSTFVYARTFPDQLRMKMEKRDPWQSFNLAKRNAFAIVQARAAEIEAYELQRLRDDLVRCRAIEGETVEELDCAGLSDAIKERAGASQQ